MEAFKVLQPHPENRKLWLPGTPEGVKACQLTGQAAYRAGEWETALVGGFAMYEDVHAARQFARDVCWEPTALWRVEYAERLTAPARLVTVHCMATKRVLEDAWAWTHPLDETESVLYFQPDPLAMWAKGMRLAEMLQEFATIDDKD